MTKALFKPYLRICRLFNNTDTIVLLELNKYIVPNNDNMSQNGNIMITRLYCFIRRHS